MVVTSIKNNDLCIEAFLSAGGLRCCPEAVPGLRGARPQRWARLAWASATDAEETKVGVALTGGQNNGCSRITVTYEGLASTGGQNYQPLCEFA